MAWSKRSNNQHVFKTVDWKWRIFYSNKETSICGKCMCQACGIASAFSLPSPWCCCPHFIKKLKLSGVSSKMKHSNLTSLKPSSCTNSKYHLLLPPPSPSCSKPRFPVCDIAAPSLGTPPLSGTDPLTWSQRNLIGSPWTQLDFTWTAEMRHLGMGFYPNIARSQVSYV